MKIHENPAGKVIFQTSIFGVSCSVMFVFRVVPVCTLVLMMVPERCVALKSDIDVDALCTLFLFGLHHFFGSFLDVWGIVCEVVALLKGLSCPVNVDFKYSE